MAKLDCVKQSSGQKSPTNRESYPAISGLREQAKVALLQAGPGLFVFQAYAGATPQTCKRT